MLSSARRRTVDTVRELPRPALLRCPAQVQYSDMKGGLSWLGFFVFVLLGRAQPGSVDLSFVPELDTNFHVHAVWEQTDGKLLVAGHRGISYQPTNATILRLNTDGTLDRKFPQREIMRGDFGIRIAAIRQRSDRKIMVVGSFGGYDGRPRKDAFLLHRNGRLASTTFPVNQGSPGFGPGRCAIQNDGAVLYHAPDPNVYYGCSLRHIDSRGRLDSDPMLLGAKWWRIERMQMSHQTHLTFGVLTDGYHEDRPFYALPSNEVHWIPSPHTGRIDSFAALNDRTYYLAGNGISYGRQVIESNRWVSKATYQIARFTEDGLDTGFLFAFTSSQPEFYEDVDIAAQSDGRVLYTTWRYTPAQGWAFVFGRVETNGAPEVTFAPALPDDLTPIERVKPHVLRDGKILLVGPFLSCGGLPRIRLVRLHP